MSERHVGRHAPRRRRLLEIRLHRPIQTKPARTSCGALACRDFIPLLAGGAARPVSFSGSPTPEWAISEAARPIISRYNSSTRICLKTGLLTSPSRLRKRTSLPRRRRTLQLSHCDDDPPDSDHHPAPRTPRREGPEKQTGRACRLRREEGRERGNAARPRDDLTPGARPDFDRAPRAARSRERSSNSRAPKPETAMTRTLLPPSGLAVLIPLELKLGLLADSGGLRLGTGRRRRAQPPAFPVVALGTCVEWR